MLQLVDSPKIPSFGHIIKTSLEAHVFILIVQMLSEEVTLWKPCILQTVVAYNYCYLRLR